MKETFLFVHASFMDICLFENGHFTSMAIIFPSFFRMPSGLAPSQGHFELTISPAFSTAEVVELAHS